jgi:flagellar biosynthetic protein FliO
MYLRDPNTRWILPWLAAVAVLLALASWTQAEGTIAAEAGVRSRLVPSSQPATTQPAATQPAATQPAATQPAATQPAAAKRMADANAPAWYASGHNGRKGPIGLNTSVFRRLGGALVLVLLLGVGAFFAAKRLLPRLRGSSAQRRMRLVETIYLGPKKSLHLVTVAGRQYLVGSGREGLTMLSEVPAAEGSFDEHLRNATARDSTDPARNDSPAEGPEAGR